MASLALRWVSRSPKRAFTELPSNCTKSAVRPASFKICAMRGASDESTFTMVLPLLTCTAGASGKKLGSV